MFALLRDFPSRQTGNRTNKLFVKCCTAQIEWEHPFYSPVVSQRFERPLTKRKEKERNEQINNTVNHESKVVKKKSEKKSKVLQYISLPGVGYKINVCYHSIAKEITGNDHKSLDLHICNRTPVA